MPKQSVWTKFLVGFFVVFLGAGLYGLIASQEWFWDLTSWQTYTLTPASKSLLHAIDSPIRVAGFFEQNTVEKGMLRGLFSAYHAQNNQFLYTFIDPVREPNQALAWGESRRGVVIIQIKDRRFRLPLESFFQVSVAQGMPVFKGEEVLSGAIAEGFSLPAPVIEKPLGTSVQVILTEIQQAWIFILLCLVFPFIVAFRAFWVYLKKRKA
ncbi:MAG: Gldg family protein [Candidatus Margulisiibacteriota bacterium]